MMMVIPEKGKWTGLVQVVGESGRFGRNFSGVGDDLRGHTGKMTRHESAWQFRSCDSRDAPIRGFAISIFRYYPEFRRRIPRTSQIEAER